MVGTSPSGFFHDPGTTMPATFSRVLICLALLAFNEKIIAQENLLGMPRPLDPHKPGAVFLHGGGRITNEVFERFWQLAGAREARIVLVPCAGFRPADYNTEAEFLQAVSNRYGSWVALGSRGFVKSFQFLYTDNTTDADDPRFVRALESATGVWFSGGAQSRLNYRFVGNYPNQTKFQIALRGIIERGGVVGGTSAGMAALPEIMTMYEYRNYTSGPANAVAAHGLGLLRHAIVEQHFDARGGRLERFTGLLRDNAKLDALALRRNAGEQMIGLAVEEGGALVARGDRLEVLGYGDSHIFVKTDSGRTLSWNRLSPGDTAQLRREAPGTVMRREETTISR
jgi:cyanophycinase